MNKRIGPIVFFGSGPVATKSLSSIMGNVDIEAIITKPSAATRLEAVSKDRSIPIYSVTSGLELDKLFGNKKFRSSVGLLIDFGIIVSSRIIDSFPLGIINSHFSLLPEWRGPDPIAFAVLSGQKQTGVSLMLLNSRIDEGPLLAQSIYKIPASSTTPSLTTQLISLSNTLIITITPLYLSHKIVPKPQLEGNILGNNYPTYSKKLSKIDSIIDWRKPAQQLEREIRAFIEWPKSQTTLANREVVITDSRVSHKKGPIGQVLIEGKRLFFYCKDGALEIKKLKPAGKPEMTIEAFLAGYRQYL